MLASFDQEHLAATAVVCTQTGLVAKISFSASLASPQRWALYVNHIERCRELLLLNVTLY